MKTVWIALGIWLSVAGCAFHEPYPSGWPERVGLPAAGAFDLSGAYRNPVDGKGDGCRSVADALKLPADPSGRVEEIRISHDACDALTVSAWTGGNLLGNKVFEQESGGLTCGPGGLSVDLPAEAFAEQVSGVQWSRMTLQSAVDGSLVIENESSAVGLLFVVPIGGTQSVWLRLVEPAP